ncbi:MAG TPA: type 1 glutamine amidotransferase [Candidatus Aquicultor sp.]|jgi:GMP synthase (glutamine-hydrolysing)
MNRRILILENDDVPEEQNLSAVMQRLIEERIDSIVFEPGTGFARPIPGEVCGVIVGGGLPSVNDARPWIAEETAFVRSAATAALPVLGICFGHQLIGKAFGAEVARGEKHIGFAKIEQVRSNPLFRGLPECWRSPAYHQDCVMAVPHGFSLIATSDYCAVQAMVHDELPIWSVQFHPEIRFGINAYFADPVAAWDDKDAFENAPNIALIENFIDVCTKHRE